MRPKNKWWWVAKLWSIHIWAFINCALIHTHPHPVKKWSHLPTPTKTHPKKGHTHPHPAKKSSHTPTPSSKKVTLTHTQRHPAKNRSHSPIPTYTQTKKGHTHLRPAKKGHTPSHPPTPSQKKPQSPTPIHMQPRKSHTHPHLAKNRTYPLKFSRKCREKKIFHYPLGNQICQKLKKSSITIDQ